MKKIPRPSPPSLIVLLAWIGLLVLCGGCLRKTDLVSQGELEGLLAGHAKLQTETVGDGAAELLIEPREGADDGFHGSVWIEDLIAQPEQLAAYDEVDVRIAGYPAQTANQLSHETAILVADRFEVILRSVDADVGEAERVRWLEKNTLLLGQLGRLAGPPVAWLLSVLTVAVVFLLVLILVFKLQAFLALIIASIVVGIGAGMPLQGVIQSVIDGMGTSLGFIAIIIGVGAILGKILEYSGGAKRLAESMLGAFGEKRAPWAMLVTGFLISIPVFFDVGLVILISIVYALARRTGRSLLFFGLPLVAGMATTHAFIPPTPGPILVAQNLDVGLGWVILFGAIIGFPTAVVAGPILGGWLARRHFVPVPDLYEPENPTTEEAPMRLPGLGTVLLIIGLPIGLILLNTVLGLLIERGTLRANPAFDLLLFMGHPVIALILSTLAALYLLGTRCGASRTQLMGLSTAALGPAGIIILVTGAGGVLKQILSDSGVGETLADQLSRYPLGPLVLAYIFAVVVRVTQGSATVSMIAASALIAPFVDSYQLGEMDKALVVIAIAAGATILSHVNDSGFWIVNRYFGMSEKTTLQTWTVVTTVISIVGFLLAFALSALI